MKNTLLLVFTLLGIYCLNEFGIVSTIGYAIKSDNNAKIAQKNADSIAKASMESNYIKWMEFNVPLEVMKQALSYDVNSFNDEIPLDWIQLISYGAAKNWGKFEKEKECKEIDDIVKKIKGGERIDDLTKDLKLYNFYLQTYSAVLDGFVGEYELLDKKANNSNEEIYVRKYGLKVFSPIAKGFGYSHYDDFGVSRSYGYKRRHLGNDLFGSVGTPVVAIEDGYVEVMGWNQFGGWRIGIRSHDKKRYYYYAHLKKDHPFATGLSEGDFVQAGDVIGYLGMTGYSTKENINNIKIPHLHFGMQIIFDESQKDGSNQIWIDVYQIINLLEKNRMEVHKNPETNEYIRSINIRKIPID